MAEGEDLANGKSYVFDSKEDEVLEVREVSPGEFDVSFGDFAEVEVKEVAPDEFDADFEIFEDVEVKEEKEDVLEVKEVAPDEFDAHFGDFAEFEPPASSQIEEIENLAPSGTSSSSESDGINDNISLSSCSSSSTSSLCAPPPAALPTTQPPRRLPFADGILLHVAPFLSILQLLRLSYLDKR